MSVLKWQVDYCCDSDEACPHCHPELQRPECIKCQTSATGECDWILCPRFEAHR